MKPCHGLHGWLVGTCANSTVSLSANLLLRIHGVAENRIHGELCLYGELGGGGPFHGSIQGDNVRFTTCVPAMQMVIAWIGNQTDEGLAGTYEVWSDRADLAAQGLQEQAGIWSCALVGAPEETGADRTKLVWVFHQGRSEGPFSVELLVKHATAERWPLHALVARENFTVWNSLREFLDSIEAGRVARN